MISGYLGNSDAFDKAIATFATAYADQSERDHDVLDEGGARREDRSCDGAGIARSPDPSVQPISFHIPGDVR